MTTYAVTLATYFFIDLILILSVNLQIGLLGLANLGFVLFMGGGAYAVALLSLGPMQSNSLQHYIFGVSLPFPVPLIGAVLFGCLLGLVVGAMALYRMRGHYLAIMTIAILAVAWEVVSGLPNLLGGGNGLSLIPQPFHSAIHGVTSYSLFYLAFSGVLACLCFIFTELFFKSPLGRTGKAIRENEKAAVALGKNAYRVRLIVTVCGGGMAALSGALLAQYATVWTPQPWSFAEIFPATGAMIIGGRGNNWGAALGTLIVDIAIGQGITFVPGIGSNPNLSFAIEWIAYGVLIIGFIWLRPAGLIPERKARWRKSLYGVSAAAGVSPLEQMEQTGSVPGAR